MRPDYTSRPRGGPGHADFDRYSMMRMSLMTVARNATPCFLAWTRFSTILGRPETSSNPRIAPAATYESSAPTVTMGAPSSEREMAGNSACRPGVMQTAKS